MKRRFLRWWYGFRYGYCFEHCLFKQWWSGSERCVLCESEAFERRRRKRKQWSEKRDRRLEALR